MSALARTTLPWLLAMVMFAPAGAAHAADGDRVPAEVLIVLASEEAGEVDAELRAMSALQRAPFNAFRSMRVLSRPRVDLRQGDDTDIQLPNGRRLRIHLVHELPDGRYRVRVSINRPNQRDYLPVMHVVVSPGDPFFVAGQSHEGGTLIIGVRLGRAASEAAAE